MVLAQPAAGTQVSGIILAGGASHRMGRDKAHLPWGDATLIERVIATLRPLTDELIVAVRDAGPFRHIDRVTVVADLVPGAHALGGLYTGLRAASHQRCFVCACDMPFLQPRLIRFLIAQAEDDEAVIPRTPQGLQPLHAVYARSALPVIEDHLRRRQWELQAVVARLRARIIPPSVVRRYDPEGCSDRNLNTPEEYKMWNGGRLTPPVATRIMGSWHARPDPIINGRHTPSGRPRCRR